MTKEQCQLLRNRNIIENVWSVLKLNYNLIYHRARSVVGMFRHFFSVFLLFCFIGFMKNITFPYKIQSFAENSIFDLINIVNHNLHCDVSPMPEKYFSIPLPVSHFISSHTFPPGDWSPLAEGSWWHWWLSSPPFLAVWWWWAECPGHGRWFLLPACWFRRRCPPARSGCTCCSGRPGCSPSWCPARRMRRLAPGCRRFKSCHPEYNSLYNNELLTVLFLLACSLVTKC